MSGTPSVEKQEVSNKPEVEVSIENQEAQVKQYVAEVISREFSGPIPPPEIIKGYELILPGAADRILTMAENQSKHRQDMEEKIITSESRDSLLGVLFAFFLGIGCIVAAIIIVVLVPQNSGAISGAILGLAGISSIIVTFIKGTRSSHNSSPKDTAPVETNDKSKDVA